MFYCEEKGGVLKKNEYIWQIIRLTHKSKVVKLDKHLF